MGFGRCGGFGGAWIWFLIIIILLFAFGEEGSSGSII